jgi:hypothetical protein
LRQIGEPPSDQVWVDSRRGAAQQSAKLIQIDRLAPFRSQIGVKELEMADLIVGVVVDVLVHVLVQHRKRRGVGRIPGPTRDFVVLDAAEFVVLLPQIGFDDFCCRKEPENGLVVPGETASRYRHGGIGQQSGAEGSCSDGE